jgi:FtsP/CotA-like multicopper oxidase with cupredoxin domain
VALPGAKLLVVGWDGGLIPEPYVVETLLITPGERYDVLVTFADQVGTRLELQTHHYDRGHDVPDLGIQPLMRVVLGPPRTHPAKPLPSTWAVLPSLPIIATTPVSTFVLKEALTPSGLLFSINDKVWPFADPVMVKQGDVEIWELQNESEMDHPVHLHGMFFEVLETNGVPLPRRGWKDTVNVPKSKERIPGTARLAVRYEPLGMWMFHCHILEHAERGMMGALMVMP